VGPAGVGHQAGGHEGTRRQTGLTKKMSALHVGSFEMLS
jgi:hypothetical protein